MGGNSDTLCQTIMHDLGLTELGDLAIPPTPPNPEPMDLSMSEEELEETMEEVYKKLMNTVQEKIMEKNKIFIEVNRVRSHCQTSKDQDQLPRSKG